MTESALKLMADLREKSFASAQVLAPPHRLQGYLALKKPQPPTTLQ